MPESRPFSFATAIAPLRVGLEVRSLDRGGLESVIAELARGLPELGVEPVIFCTESGGALADELRREGRKVEILSGDNRAAELDVLLLRHDVQLLNAHYSTLGTSVAAARDLPVVVTLHNAYAWLGAAVFDETRALSDRVAAYAAVSRSVAEFCAARFQIDPRRIEVVRNGARMRRTAPDEVTRLDLRRRLGIAPDAELVVQIAACSRVKCQLALVDAIAALREARPRLVAWIVGPTAEEDYAEQVRRRVADAGLAERVVLAGRRDDVDSILGAADVFALPSVIEGLSLAAVESLQAGVPAVLTRTGDADFLLAAAGGSGSEEGGAPRHPPGLVIDGPKIDPLSVDWESLREIAGAEHPSHAPALASALAAVLDDLPGYRTAAAARGAELARLLTPEEMCRRTAVLLLRVAAAHGVERVRSLDRRRIDLEESVARERAASAELRRAVLGLGDQLQSAAADLRGRVDGLAAEMSVAKHLVGETLAVSQRTLDKLRLQHRAQNALRAVAARLGFGMRRSGGHAAGIPRRATGNGSDRGAAQLGRTAGAALPRGRRAEHWLVLAVVPFDDIGGAQRSAQLTRALLARGALVTYAARFPRSESVDLGIDVHLPGLDVVPFDADALRAWLRDRDERIRLLVEVPDAEIVALAAFARARGARVVFDKVDAWESCAWATWYRPEVERELVAASDDLVASARLLQRGTAVAGRNVHLVPNAVDRALFRPESARERAVPADLARGAVTLAYAGSLWGDWFDWEIVAGIAAARPDWRVNLIGDPPQARPANLPANVLFLGLKPQSELPAYYAAADACLIPFTPGPVVDAVNPLKVYEYLAMHRPVVATPMPELRDLPYVFTAADASSTVAAVERAIATPAPVAEIESFLARNTWQERAAALAGIVERPTIAVIVLCYNNADVIDACVRSLVRFRGDLAYQIAVVDNGSSDGSLEILEAHERAGAILLLRNQRNGCSSGRNLGLAATRSEVVAFLDSDQWAEREGWLDPALEILNRHREIGAVGWNAGWFDPGSGRGPIVDYLPERGMAGEHAGAMFRTDVAYLATSGLVAPRAVLARTEGFDEFYDPTCFEDTDLSFQIKALGYEIAYCPRIGVGHRPHQTTGSLDDYSGYLARNERYFLQKWRDRPEFFLRLPGR